jgi:hypothetical protein
MKGGKKYNAIFLAMCMIVTAFVAVVSLSVSAQVNINTELELDGTGIYGPYYVGSTGNPLSIRLIDIDGGGDITDAWTNITTTDPDFTFTDDEGNWGDQPYQTGGSNWLWDEPPSVTSFFTFTFDVDNSCPIGDHTATLHIDYTNSAAVRRNDVQQSITIQIRSRASTSTAIDLYAGDDFKELTLWVNPNVPNIDWDDVYLNITRPDSDFTWESATINANTATGWMPGLGSLPSTGDFFYYRIQVADDKDPGIYTFTYTLEFTAGGERYYESGNEIDILVDFTPIIEASGTTIIQQGNTSVEFPITFTNNGNVDLFNVEVRLGSITAGATRFFDIPYDHYEGTLPGLYWDWTPIGDLDMGDSAQAMLSASVDPYIPAGEHKILLDWRGWYNDEGQTQQATRSVEVMGNWYSGSAPNPPYEEQIFEVGGPVIMDENEFEVNTHTGAFVTIDVTDDELSFTGQLIGTIPASGDVTNRQITVRLTNKEQVQYKDLFVELDVGANTPFLNPVDHTADTVEMDTLINDWIPGGGTRDIYFHVDVNAGWWQDNSVAPGMYVVDVIVDATNDVTEARIEDTMVPVAMEVTGFGPELLATVVDYGDIEPGKEFTLTVTITNFGDDTAREVDAYLRADFVAGWTIVDQFVTSISSYGGNNWWGGGGVGDASWGWETDWANYDLFNRSNNINPGDIGVDNVPQIIELNDWIKRRETPPQGVVLWIHLDRLPAGEEHVFSFEMISDVNMVKGMAYYETLDLYYVDSNGRSYGPPGSGANEIIEGQQVLIRSGKGDKYTGEEEMDWSVVLYAIIFLIIALIVFLIGFALGGKGGRPTETREEPYKPFEEEEYQPPEEELAPPPPEEKPPV